MKKKLFKTRLLSFAAFCGLALAFASCANEDVAQGTTGTETDNEKNLTTFVAGDEAKTRTSMDYTSGNFFWEAGDYIYVKDDDDTWRKSSNAPTSKVASFKFKVPGRFKNHTTYKVYYPGKNGSNNQVTISATQTQRIPNTTDHFGVSGDCGTADASKQSNGSFAFALDHQAAILVFQPYTSNTILQSCYMTKVEVTSDNDITHTYTLNPVTGKLTGTGSGKQIILTTKGSGTYANGFPLTSTAASVTTNGAYMVIKPGTHTLKVRYWIKDIVTKVEGTITKLLPSTIYAPNTYYDMTSNLNVANYDGDHYYMWDAQEQYWKGHEWWSTNKDQPVLSGNSNSNYAKNNSDSRYYNTTYLGYGISNPATHASCKDLPNANEMSWYAMYGDPRWDADELWTTMGHLYKGGMWFKKKSVLITEGHYNTEKSADGTTDMRTTYKIYDNSNSSIKNSGLPSVAEASNYFYLPAIGYYYSGQLYFLGRHAFYWSSIAHPWNNNQAYYLGFGSDNVEVNHNYRYFGFRVGTFE